jgi:aspartate/methionine/tyrosine aminotransferase
MKTAQRIEGVSEYYFAKKLREIRELDQDGGPKVLNLGIGSPDLPPHPSVVEALCQGAAQPQAHGYQAYRGTAELREAFAQWYRRSYGVALDPASEIMPLLGSKEGIMHLTMSYAEPGDEVLVPNPGYPTYEAVARLAQATPRRYPLHERLGWLPDLDALAQEGLGKAKMLWINYPNMPTGAQASRAFFDEAVAFAREHGILLCHDNPYSFILNPNPQSLLQAQGALEVAVELNSLSKSHNMAGWRMGMLAGRADRLDEVARFKTNMDSGMFLPVQQAAAAALRLGPDWFASLNAVYEARRRWAWEIMEAIGCVYERHAVGMFVWAKIPANWPDGMALSDRLLREARVFITPGSIFGSQGDGHIRLSLCSSEAVLQEALARIQAI